MCIYKSFYWRISFFVKEKKEESIKWQVAFWHKQAKNIWKKIQKNWRRNKFPPNNWAKKADQKKPLHSLSVTRQKRKASLTESTMSAKIKISLWFPSIYIYLYPLTLLPFLSISPSAFALFHSLFVISLSKNHWNQCSKLIKEIP